MEHLQYFELAQDPFRNEPLPSLFLETRPHQDALRRLDRGVRQAKGLSLLIGEPGSGKTMVVRRLLDRLEEEVFEAGMLVVINDGADASWMLRRFATQLGIEQPAPERETLLAQLYDQLAIVREEGRHTVLIVDDAQTLVAGRALAELAGLLKLEYEDRRLLSLVLAGTPELERAVAADPVLAHRVDVKAHLKPLDAESAGHYLAERIARAGGSASIVDAAALQTLHVLGRGLPGPMNTLADNALFEAFLCGRSQMSRIDVERAHRDLLGDLAGPDAATELPPPAPPHAEGEPAVRDPFEPAAERPAAPALEPFEMDPLEHSGSDLDSELEAVFEVAERGAGPTLDGPPKDDPDSLRDLLVDLLED